MPSKGGRREATANAITGPPVAVHPARMRSHEEWEAAGFTAAELARPLRRGLDVGRFTELAAREDELAPAEAEELYAFRLRRVISRLRQLARAHTRGG